jgi:hypothetical protein
MIAQVALEMIKGREQIIIIEAYIIIYTASTTSII